MFLINSRYPHFSAATPEEVRHTLSRSYGVNLPSSLTRFNSNALEYSSHSPESVYGTGNLGKHNEAFLGSMASPNFRTNSSSLHASELSAVFSDTSYTLTPPQPAGGWDILLRPSYTYTKLGNRILAVFPSTTPIGLVLGLD